MLIILFFITAILVLTGISFLKIAGIFFAICYLPGLSVLALAKKDALEFEDLILSFPVSVGMSSLLTLGLLYAGVHVRFIAYVLYGIIGCIIFFSVMKYRKGTSLRINLSGEEIRFISVAVLITLMFSIPLISERIAISAHGFHHLSIVTRIFNGFFPPDNPGMGGTMIGYHWGFHTLVAAISHPSNFNPLRIFQLFNMMSLFFIFCLSYRCARFFEISEKYCYLVPLALLGLMRSDAGIFYAINLIKGTFPAVENIASAPLNLLSSWVSGVSYLDTRLFFMNKFYNANNMPSGLCLLFAFFLILLLMMEEKIKNIHKKLYLKLLSLVLIALAIVYAFFLIIPLLFVPIWAGVLFFTNAGSYRDKLKESFTFILPCVIAAAITAPYLYTISSGSSVVTAGKSAGEFKFIYLNVQVIRNLIVFLLPSLFILAGFWFAFRRFAFSRRFLFLLSGSLICLLLSIFLRLNWSNSVKFSFVLAFFFAHLFVFSMTHLLPFFSHVWSRRMMAWCIAVFLLATPIITEAAYICSPWFRDDTYAFKGRQVIFERDKSRNEAYMWIRDNTPSDSLLMLPYLDTPFGITIANVISYRPVALSERSLFVVKDAYAYLLSEYEERVAIREQILINQQNTQVRKYLASLNRPVYLLVEKGYSDPLMEGVEFDHVPEQPEFPLVFSSSRQKVYLIQFSN